MSTLLFQNLANGVKAKEEILNGSKYLVAPLVMIVPGILNGSRGRGLYLEEDLKPSVQDWNGMPITLDHPLLNGVPVSGRRPDILRNYWLGNVFNAEFSDKLRSEGWFHVNATKALAPKIHKALLEGTPFELSTGLNADTVPSSGQLWNGKTYDFRVINIKPDHLAVLPNSVGACSLQDGCGVMVNEYSHSNLKMRIETLLLESMKTEYTSSLSSEMSDNYPYVIDVFEDYFVYRMGQDIYKQGYKADLQKEKVKLSEAKPVKVQRVTVYSPTNNEEKDQPTMNPNVDFIIANCSCWGENDRELLNGMGDDKLKVLRKSIEEGQTLTNELKTAKAKIAELTPAPAPAPAKTEQTPEPVNNKDEKKPMTAEEWLASAPGPIANAVKSALQFQTQERDRLVGKLIANKDEATQAKLVNIYKDMDISALQILADNIPTAPVNNQQNPDEISILQKWANHQGAEPSFPVRNRGTKPVLVTEHEMIFNEDEDAA